MGAPLAQLAGGGLLRQPGEHLDRHFDNLAPGDRLQLAHRSQEARADLVPAQGQLGFVVGGDFARPLRAHVEPDLLVLVEENGRACGARGDGDWSGTPGRGVAGRRGWLRDGGRGAPLFEHGR
ncbi:MAG: hypothetical protein FWD74_12555 [Actinomycetia bacterium]|nr:hypothetical protein [Actinomycetes bacterium]